MQPRHVSARLIEPNKSLDRAVKESGMETGGCKSDCSNRKRRLQCNPDTCPCGVGCTNVLFRTRIDGKEVLPAFKSAKLGVFNTPKKGGLRANLSSS